MKVQRPIPNREVPFQDDQGTFESFLMTWNFLVVYGRVLLRRILQFGANILLFRHPLHLSTFTLDEFEHALRHSVVEPHCALLAEIHSTLIYNLRTVPFQRHSAIRSIMYHEDQRMLSAGASDPHDPVLGLSFQQLSNALSDVGNNWERVPLRASEGREGWEDALVGCLKDVRFHALGVSVAY